MSVRIYELSKQLNMENKELIALLQSRGMEVKSASSSIANIYADDLIEEFKAKAKEEAKVSTEGEAKAKADSTAKQAEEPAPPAAKPAPKVPDSARFVKTAAEVEKERAEKIEAARPKPATPPVAPARPSPAAKTPPPPPVARPAAKVPPPPPVARPAAKVPPPPPASKPIVKAAPPPPPAIKPAAAHAAPPPPPPAAAKPTSKTAPTPPPPLPAERASASGKPAPAAPPAVAASGSAEEKGAAEVKERTVQVKPPIVVRDFAGAIGLKPFQLISELMEFGIFGSMNQTIEEDVAQKIAAKHNFVLEVRHRGEAAAARKEEEEMTPEREAALMKPRAPVVTVMGHVDHGKTTLLDAIRKTRVVSGEAGGITQHVGAYQVESGDNKITILDTPGHAAFSKMRERSASLTDVVILVVAADDGFMPQTDEALKFAQKAGVPIVVAINKIDAKGANIDRVKQMMQQRGITPEDWGGETLCQPISALKQEGIEDLLEQVILQAEILELKANPDCPAEGIVVESQVEQGRGSTATVIVQKGTLKKGDAIICGTSYCRVRAMMDDRGKPLNKAIPSTPVLVMGWSDAPRSGATFQVVASEREARRIAEERIYAEKQSVPEEVQPAPATLETLFAAIAETKQVALQVIIKGDVHGTVEALKETLEDIDSAKVKLQVIDSSVGMITKKDILLASTSGAVIVGFNVKQESGVQALAKHHGVRIIQHDIIYELIDQVQDAMADLLEPELHEQKLGAAEVRQVFSVSKGGRVAGCMVTQGQIRRMGFARVLRKGEVVHEGKITTLKRFKDDATEVRAGYECGVNLEGFNNYEIGDIIECYEVQQTKPSLF